MRRRRSRPGNGREAVEQGTKILLAVEITAPFREILRHEIQFLDPLIQQARASRTIMSLQWERCPPRILGMAQNEQAWRQPSLILSHA